MKLHVDRPGHVWLDTDTARWKWACRCKPYWPDMGTEPCWAAAYAQAVAHQLTHPAPRAQRLPTPPRLVLAA